VPVRVVVGGAVSSVEIVLDGKPAGLLAGPDWSADLDLGTEIAPHELVARALGADRRELARARQWLNLPRPPAEVEILLERNASGLATAARLSWESLTGARPRSVRATFDGGPIPVLAESRVAIPAYDPEQVQLLSLELEFDDAVRARKDLVFGGRAGEQAQSELTAVPLRARPGAKPPSTLPRGALKTPERSLDVAAVEEGAGILLVVRDSLGVRGLGRPDMERYNAMWYRTDLSLDRQTAVRFLWPRPVEYRGNGLPAELFPGSREFDGSAGGLRWLLTRVVNPAPEPRAPRFTDAVAVAGLHAYGTFRRRAVLLVLDGQFEDASQYPPDAVRRFLRMLRVPFFVWSIGRPTGARAPWSEAVDVSAENALRTAFDRIRDELAGQRIVWVEGRVLPQDIRLVEDAAGYELVD